MIAKKELYSEARIGKLRSRLEDNYVQGHPEDYEIYVDAIKAVRRTDDPSRFNTYENYVDEDTKEITVIIFDGRSGNNTKYPFLVKEEEPKPQEHGLSGPELETFVSRKLEDARKEWKNDLLVSENNKLKGENKELREAVTKLQEAVRSSQKGFSLDGLADTIGTIAGAIARTKPEWLEKIPGGSVLAGLAGVPGQEQATTEEGARPEAVKPADVSFKVKEQETISEEDRAHIRLLQKMKETFNEEELVDISAILDYLTKEKKQISAVKFFLMSGVKGGSQGPTRYPAQE